MKNWLKVVADENCNEEIAPGVMIERRRLLWLPALAVAALAVGQESEAKAQTSKGAWDEFLTECLPKAQELHNDASRNGQEAYLRWLGFMAVKVQAAELPPAKLGKFKDLEPATYFGVGYRGKPFFVVEWRMEPGAFLPPHCHPNVSVCTVGLEGEARIRNYEIAGDAPEFTSTKPFRVRETHNEIISAGRISTLSAVRDNIHTFQAGKEGSRGIDITTYHGANVGFSHLEISSKPTDETRRIFEAVWKKL